MSGYSHILSWRKRTKTLLIQAAGGSCRVCGYNRCQSALEFHHIEPEHKDFSLSRKIQGIEKLKTEIQKCILVCANCHREIHSGLIDIVLIKPLYIEPPKSAPILTPCAKCGILKSKSFKFCGQSCAQKAKEKVEWDKIDLLSLLEKHNGNMSAVGRALGISSNAVKKRALKIELF